MLTEKPTILHWNWEYYKTHGFVPLKNSFSLLKGLKAKRPQ